MMKKDEKNMKKFIEDVLNLPYSPNPQDNPQHENEVEALLKKHKIKYVAQPNGSQQFPDFRLLDYELDMECKSVKSYVPMWNRGLPRPDALYIITSKKLNKSHVLFGRQVCSEEKYKKLIALDEKYKQMIKDDQASEDSFEIYPRLAFKDVGGDYKNKYWNDSHVEKVFEHFGYEYEV
jgi:hypothetical protein